MATKENPMNLYKDFCKTNVPKSPNFGFLFYFKLPYFDNKFHQANKILKDFFKFFDISHL